MTKVRDIAYKVAQAVVDDEALSTYCTEEFGKAVSVFMETLGTAEFEDMEDYIFPYVIVRGGAQSGGDGVDEGFDVDLLVTINAEAVGVDNSKAVLDDNGVWVTAGTDTLATLTGMIVDAVKGARCGAVLDEFTVDYDNSTGFPVRFTLVGLGFKAVHSY